VRDSPCVALRFLRGYLGLTRNIFLGRTKLIPCNALRYEKVALLRRSASGSRLKWSER